MRRDPDLKAYFQAPLDLRSGTITQLMGWTIKSRSTVINLNSSKVIKTPEAAVVNSDIKAGLAWHPIMVERAWGAIHLFEREKDPEYFGDIYSASVRLGGRASRADNVGVFMMASIPA